jgi:hypothetical protein
MDFGERQLSAPCSQNNLILQFGSNIYGLWTAGWAPCKPDFGLHGQRSPRLRVLWFFAFGLPKYQIPITNYRLALFFSEIFALLDA